MLVESRAIFYANTVGNERGIVRFNLDTGASTVIVSDTRGLYTIKSIAVDWYSCKIVLRRI